MQNSDDKIRSGFQKESNNGPSVEKPIPLTEEEVINRIGGLYEQDKKYYKERDSDVVKLADRIGGAAMNTAIRIHDSGEKIREKVSNLRSSTKELVDTIKDELGLSRNKNREL